jgi:hypothetical protein
VFAAIGYAVFRAIQHFRPPPGRSRSPAWWGPRPKGRSRPRQTPAEFAPVVAGAVPSCADAFAELTRAYEDVRYGSLGSTRPRSGGSKRASTGSCRRSGAAEPRPPADVEPGLPAPTQERFRRFDELGARPRSPPDVGGPFDLRQGRIGVTHGFGSARARGV